jgi:hypothetical protein
MKRYKVVQYGLGPIGSEAVKVILTKEHLELVGAIDIDEAKVGKDVGELIGLPEKGGITVSRDAAEVFSRNKPDIALVTTLSFVDKVYPQLELALKHGVNVTSTTEELLYPYQRWPDLSKKIDKLAKENGVTVLGTGVNPGFVMDTLALAATGVCLEVESVKIERFLDAATRRLSLQKKVGAGMSEGEFRRLVDQGKLGHIGLVESMLLLAYGFGWEVEKYQERIDPMIADDDYKTPYLKVKKGDVAGIKHTVAGFVDGRKRLDLDLRMYVGEKEPHDSVKIEGKPPLHLVIKGGTAGDPATVAMLINSIPRVIEAPPGLTTMADLPIPRAFSV